MATAAVSDDTWLATLREVAKQAQRVAVDVEADGSPPGPDITVTTSDWVEVVPPHPPPPEAEESTVWPEHQWQIAFEILFCQAPDMLTALRPHQDDLLFFVQTDDALAAAAQQPGEPPLPLFVRRASARSRALPPDLAVGGAAAAGVDWHASVLLNIVLQTGFCLSVATCHRDDLPALASGISPSAHGDGSTAREVHRLVHASPSRVHVNIDDSRSAAARPSTCYPDIAFAVDDFSDAFQSLVLSDPDDCYCVLLHADVRAYWRPLAAAAAATYGGEGAATGKGSGDAVQLAAAGLAGLRLGDESADTAGSGRNQHHQRQQRSRGACPEREVQVFSGYVSHSQLARAMANGRSGGPEALRRLLGDPPRKEVSRVLMRGPGGLGGADVAVTCLGPAASDDGHLGASSSAASMGNGGGGGNGSQRPLVQGQRSPLPRLMQGLARGLADVARKAAAVATGEPPPLQPQQLSCALMTLLVPVDVLAVAILGAV